jgi:hypothetical protein
MDEDFEKWAAAEKQVRELIEPLLIEYFDKCEDYEETCCACQRWKAFETLLENPFKD